MNRAKSNISSNGPQALQTIKRNLIKSRVGNSSHVKSGVSSLGLESAPSYESSNPSPPQEMIAINKLSEESSASPQPQ